MSVHKSVVKGAPLVGAILGILSLSLVLVPLAGGDWPVGEADAAEQPQTTVWSIGTEDDSNAEFTGRVSTFKVGVHSPSAFPARLSGGGTIQRIKFQIREPADLADDYFLNVVAADTGQNTTSGMQVIVNGHRLTPRWAGSWEFSKWANGGRNQGVQTLRWALPSHHLKFGENTLELRVSSAPNAGPDSQPDGVEPYFDMDYVSLERGKLNLAQPKRYLGSTEYWTDDAIIAQKNINNSQFGDGEVWIDYLLDRNTLDSDVEIVEEMHWTTSYPDLDWQDVHLCSVDDPDCAHPWNEAAWKYYRYTYEQLRAAGVERILVKIQYTPLWASSYQDPDYTRYAPSNDDYWVEFIKETALRLGDVVDDYAIMNEVSMSGFWMDTIENYYRLERLAYDTLYEWDTVDADGDGVACFVAPSSSNEPQQTEMWQEWYDGLYSEIEGVPKMDAFHTHDYKWGIKPGVDDIQKIDPTLEYIISETGPANWFIDQNVVPEYNPAAMASAVGYLLKDPTSTVDVLIQWLLKGDPEKDCPWPDEGEWANTEPDPYANNDGYFETFNSGLLNLEPPGPPYTNWRFTSAGAYWQHWGWVFDWDGPQVPVEVVNDGDWQYEVDAVDLGDRIEVIVTNFEGGVIPTPHTITLLINTPADWTGVKVDRYDPDDLTSTTTVAGPQITLTAANLELDSVRWVLSNASAPHDAVPSAFIRLPAKSAVVSGTVEIVADVYDDGNIASVEYRIDPINEDPYVSTDKSWESESVADGAHAIQVRVTDDAGQSSTVSHVVIVNNTGVAAHVDDIAMSYWAGGLRYGGVAVVTIVDASNNPLAGALVIGNFGEAPSDVVRGVTDAEGRVKLVSSKASAAGTWTFCADNVVKAGWVYDVGANVETCGSISVP